MAKHNKSVRVVPMAQPFAAPKEHDDERFTARCVEMRKVLCTMFHGYVAALNGMAFTELNMVACACGMWPDDFIDAVLAPRARRAPQMSGEDFAAAINFLGNLAIDRGLLRYGPRYEA